MPNYGAHHSARSDINTIRNLLMNTQPKDPSLFFILKELIQNGDDCGSQNMSIGWSNGIKKAKHPLLRGPAVVVVNDGSFNKKDEKSIRSIGASAKENDSAAVGKFGIGLKTVFLICEAFFYLTGPNAKSEKPDQEIESGSMLNLWYTNDPDDVPPSEWDKLEFETSDQNLISKEREKMGFEDGFLLWLPLRKEEHCKRGREICSIAPNSNFIGDQKSYADEFSQTLINNIASLFPLLKNIHTIQVSDGEENNIIQLTQESSQSLKDFKTQEIQPKALKGEITVNEKSQQYFGYQQLLNNTELTNLKDQEDWPKLIPNIKGHQEKQKAEQHCASVLLARPKESEQGTLLIRWAVFLPTTERPKGGDFERITIKSNEDYILTLHGFFFLGADRRRILDWSTSDGGVLRKWNQILAEQGTLALLLPALADFAQARSREIVKELTEKLKRSDFWHDYKEFICANSSLVYVVRFDRPSESCWQLVEAETNIYSIPESKSLIKVLPGLKKFSRDYILTYESWPILSQQKPKKISAPDVASLLRQSYRSASKICANPDKVETLLDFLQFNKSTDNPQVTKTLQGFIKQALSSTDSKLASNLSKLLKIVPSTNILYIPEDFTEELSSGLLGIQSQVTCLIAPSSLKPNNNSTATDLSESDAQKILERISQFSHNHISLVESFALDILKFSWGVSYHLPQSIKQLSLFQLKPIKQASKNQVVSLNQLQNHLNRKHLFSQRNQLAIALNEALSISLYTAKTEINHYLTKNITACNLESAIALLSEQPRLQPISERKNFLKELLKYLDNTITPKQQQVIRYLLHGECNHFSSMDTLFYAGEEGDNDLWYRVLRHLIGSNQEWRFISSELLNILNSQERKIFDIAKVNKESIQEELQLNRNISRINWFDFSKKDREELICSLEDNVVKELCIHETTKGNLVALDEHTYLEGGFEIEASLAQKLGITLICKSKNDQVAYRQDKLIPLLTPEDALKRILVLPNPEQHWCAIMKALEANPSECSQIRKLKTTAWLPLQNGECCKPEDVLYIPKLQEHLVRLSAECDGAFIASNDLLPDLQKHSAFNSLHQKVFPKTKDALQMLGEMLLDNPEYCVGNVEIANTDTSQSMTLQNWLSAFEAIPEEIMPAVSLLQPLSNSDARILYQALQGELDSDKLVSILNELSRQYKKKTKTNRRNIYLVYCEYLKLAVEHDDWFEIILPQIELLNQLEEWKSSKALCYEGVNVNNHYLLDKSLGKILEPLIERAGARQDKDVLDSVEKNPHDFLKDYFSEWPNSTSNAISAFLSCLGNNDKIRDLATSYRPNADSFPSQLIINENTETLSDFLVEQKINFEFRESTETSITVNNLLGESLSVELEDLSEAKSLLVGSPNIAPDSALIHLRYFSQNESPQILIDFLYYTILEILESVYGIEPNNFDSLWQEWQDAAPPDIRLTQNFLLKEAMFYLRQNQLSEDNKIARLIRKRVEFRKNQAEKELLEEQEKPIPESLSKSLNQDEQSFKGELRELLEEDSETHNLLLEGVRKRIQDTNYDIASIPFEIFQNADDACSELSEMGCSNVSRKIKILIKKETLYFVYWGRGINQARFGSNDYRDKKYDDDLQKMLLLNFSDKKEGVTGKFGLGFKSVYLVSNHPRVVSDRLGFEVVGGLYPKELNKNEFNAIAEYREGDQGTVIKLPLYLPLLDKGAAEVQHQIEQFENYIPLLGAFSRWLKEFVINLKNDERSYEWREENIIPESKVAIGELISKSNNFHRALLLGTSEERFVFPLGLRGIEPLPDNYPTFWVTAPTRMKLKMGFAVNAMFRLDVGRSQLDLRGGGKKENYEIAQRLGDHLSEALRVISKFDDQKLRKDLHFTADTTRLMFWESVWNILELNIAQNNLEAEEIKFLHEMLWGEKGAMTQLYRDCDVLPTKLQLPSHFEEAYRLTCLNKVRWSVTGELAKSSVLETVLSWSSCQEINPGELISSSIAKTLQRLMGLEIKPLNLSTILQWELPKKLELTPESAAKIGKLIRPEFIENLDETEKCQLLEQLDQIKFQSEEGNWSYASSLLVLEGNTDETQIAKFAANACLLNQSYQATARALFHVCRRDYSISVVQIIKWIQEAEEEKRDAALMYLIDGERRDEVIRELKSQIPDWIKELTHPTRQEQLLDRSFREYRLKNLLDRLGLLRDESVESYDSQTSDEEETSNDDHELSSSLSRSQKKKTQKTPKELLDQLLQWWQEERTHLIPKYEQSIYPSQEWQLTLTNYKLQKPTTTKAWLALFLLGVFHTMGRQKREQHRTFLKHCEQWDWFQVMDSRKIKATDWLNLLNEYFSDIKTGERLDYYQWVRHYPAVYAFARWWEVYRDSLLFTNEVRKNWDINMVFSPRNNNQFLQGSGKGSDAPPIGKILGIGQTFVVRELLRAKILENPAMRRYAYVPVRRVRGILQALGCQGIREGGEDRNIENSKSIHSFLVEHLGEEDATFCGDYDLPFLMFDQQDQNRKKQILGDVPIISEPSLKDDVEVQWASEDGDFVTLSNGRVIPRSYME